MDPQLTRALSQTLRVEVLERIASGPASARQIAEVSGEPLSRIAYHTSVLCDTGCIRPIDPAGADPDERLYEVATLLPTTPRLPLSDSTRGHAVAAVLQRILDRGFAALGAGTLDDEEGSRIGCESLLLDERGWSEAKAILDGALERLAATRAASAKRLADSGESGVPVTIAFAGFEMAPEGQREGA